MAVAAHSALGSIEPRVRGRRISGGAVAHLSVLAGVFVALKAWGYRLDRFDLLYSKTGPVMGASYTDVHVRLPMLRVLVVLAVVAVVLLLWNAKRRSRSLPLAVLAGLGLLSLFIGGGVPALVRRFRVVPNEQRFERPYIQENLNATRAAFDLERVDVRRFPAGGEISAADVRKNQPTIRNIRLWDPPVLLDQFLNQQRVKQYFQFLDVDADRYELPAGRREVMVGAREMDTSGLPKSARTWVNQHLVYTHGYGIVAGRVDRVLPDGAPDLVVQGIPSADVPQSLRPATSRIYFGESAGSDFVVVKGAQREFDYPQGNRFAETTYTGTGGIEVGGIARRAAFAWRFRDVNLLISNAVRSESRIMFGRNVLDRARRAAPFLTFDTNPRIAVAGGRLVWILDGYTRTDMYPYAQRINFGRASAKNITGTGNYIRDAAKFVVDAEDGTVTGYAWDEKDPILAAWRRIFPGVLRPASAMPASLRAHLRYPEALFAIQTDRYGAYHITRAEDFYSRQDAWSVARDPRGTGGARTAAQYVLQMLPGARAPSFVLVRPFTPAGRPTLASYMVAHGDPGDYGRLVAYEFPSSRPVLGPELVQARINQDPVVSQQLTLWSQQQSTVIRGNLFIVPVGRSLLYVQPLYLRGQGSRLPELKRVVAVSGEKVQMADTLPEALGAILGSSVPAEGGTVADLIRSARAHYQRAQRALRDGNLEEFARQTRIVGRLLDQAAEQS
jgi:hypothetical protein